MVQLRSQSYGKTQVRVSRVTRAAQRHEFAEVTAQILLAGDFAVAYTAGDNSLVVPTDTMKNTVYVLAHQHGIDSIESFAVRLGQHFLDAYRHVEHVTVRLEERPWTRMLVDGKTHPHSFVAAGSERYWCQVLASRQETNLQSGLTGLQVLKTTGSGFAGFLQDEYTTLKETEDRIFATTIEARWPCPDHGAEWSAARQAIRTALLQVFAERYSPSVQATLYEMAAAAFDVCRSIDEITITMPNQHHLLANLQPFGLENDNVTFVPTSEPFGLISATIGRDETGTAS